MKLLELPTYIAVGSLFIGFFLATGASLYGAYQLSLTHHWDLWNGLGICSGFDLNCTFNQIGDMIIQYIPQQIMVIIMLTFLGSATIAMFIGDK